MHSEAEFVGCIYKMHSVAIFVATHTYGSESQCTQNMWNEVELCIVL